MASGPEHYAEAELALKFIASSTAAEPISTEDQRLIAQIAQVHATLALAAAQIDAVRIAQNDPSGRVRRTSHNWSAVTR